MFLPHDVSEVDRDVLTVGLRTTEIDRLQQLRRAGHGDQPADEIVSGHTIKFDPQRWTALGDLLPDTAATGLISRADVGAVAVACSRSGRWLPLLVASYVWGQGLIGYGPARLERILGTDESGTHAAQERAEGSLAAAVKALRVESARRAYEVLRGDEGITHLGPAFFTKFLYFAGMEVAAASGPQPLILDERLANRMRSVWESRQVPDAAWRWTDGGWTAYRYEVYLSFLVNAAEALSAQGQAWTPDLVELMLFASDGWGNGGRPER